LNKKGLKTNLKEIILFIDTLFYFDEYLNFDHNQRFYELTFTVNTCIWAEDILFQKSPKLNVFNNVTTISDQPIRYKKGKKKTEKACLETYFLTKRKSRIGKKNWKFSNFQKFLDSYASIYGNCLSALEILPNYS
jgi:hypothetical protein